MLFEPFRSDLPSVGFWQDGGPHWVPIDDYSEVMRLPFYDYRNGLFARLTQWEAHELAHEEEARVMTAEEYTRLDRVGIRLKPVIVRETLWEKAERVLRGRKNELERMRTREWCGRHDEQVFKQLQQHKGKPGPYSNVGKMWVVGGNFGWFDPKAPNGYMWQSLGTTHNAEAKEYTDYCQLAQFIRTRGQ